MLGTGTAWWALFSFPKGIRKASCGPGGRTSLGLLLELLWGWSRDTPAQPPAEKRGHLLTHACINRRGLCEAWGQRHREEEGTL